MNSDWKNTVDQAPTGLSLIELLVVLAIISILASTGLVYINTDGYRLRVEANNLKSTLQEARMEAVKRNENVTVTIHKNRYEITDKDGNSINKPVVYIDQRLTVLTSGHEEFDSETTRGITFTALGRATFNFHIRIKNHQGNFYKLCTHFAGRIWLEYNESGPCTAI